MEPADFPLQEQNTQKWQKENGLGFEGNCETKHHHRPKRLFFQKEIGTQQQKGRIQAFNLPPARADKHDGRQCEENCRKQKRFVIFEFDVRHQENCKGG